MTDVLDKGFVRLVDSMGDDLAVVNGARISFARHAESFGEAERGLIRYLMLNKHGSPFEHPTLSFHVKAPIFVAREWFRHRIGSFNEVSMRYKTVDPEFYIPTPSDVRVRVGKPGHYTYERADAPLADSFCATLIGNCTLAGLDYQEAVEDGVAPELARLLLPVNVYTEFLWTVNARSCLNFLELRTANEAQYEIREYANIVEEYFREQLPAVWEAFNDGGRVAP